MKDEGFGDILEILLVLAWVFGSQLIRLFRKFVGGESGDTESEAPSPVTTPRREVLKKRSAREPAPAPLPEKIQTLEDLEVVEEAMEAATDLGETLRHRDYERVKGLLADYDERAFTPKPDQEAPVLSLDVRFPDLPTSGKVAAREAFVLREALAPPRGIVPFFSLSRRKS